MTRPLLLMYCQHSVGLGHLSRSLVLAESLRRRFHVVLLNGGRLPAGTVIPTGVEVVNLPPLGHDDGYALVSHDPAVSVEQAKAKRVELILAQLARRPEVVMIELYPFGRKKFAFELQPLLHSCRTVRGPRPYVVCSVRDILVRKRRDQDRHDDRASAVCNEFFDAVLVHADPSFATLDESFTPRRPLRVPVHYTGFVAPPPVVGASTLQRRRQVLVSAGGGMVGEPLLRAALHAAPAWNARHGLATRLVTGPFLPEDAWERLVAEAADVPDVEVVRRVPDLVAAIQASTISVSQCGYNTTMDLLRARVPAVVVPYDEGKEDEQTRRAERLEHLGLVGVVMSATLGGGALVDAVSERINQRMPATRLSLDGATRTLRLLDQRLWEAA